MKPKTPDQMIAELDREAGIDPSMVPQDERSKDLDVDPEGILPDDFQDMVRAELEDAVEWITEYVSPERERAQRYYDGEVDLEDLEGRSRFVSTDVHDTIRALLPALLRIFFGSERVVEYIPRRPDDIMAAEQATDYVNQVVIGQDNSGFLLFYTLLKDALTLKTGVAKWGWVDEGVSTVDTFEGIPVVMLAQLEQDPEVEFETAPMFYKVGGVDLATVTVRRTRTMGRIKIDAVPPDELLVDRHCRNLDFSDARAVFHTCEKTVSELVEMGYGYDEVAPYAGKHMAMGYGHKGELHYGERQARAPWEVQAGNRGDTVPERERASQVVLWTEGWVRADVNGDGIAELRECALIGPEHVVLRNDEVGEIPLAVFCPDPSPHTFFGRGGADLVMDLQTTKSSVIRAMLDSLAEAVDPDTVVDENRVDLRDVLSPSLGRVIRTMGDVNTAIREMNHSFNGQAALPVLDYLDSVRERRTGSNRVAEGMDAEVLQSTTAIAVDQQFQAAQAQLQMIAQVIAETGMKRLYSCLLKEIVSRQDFVRTVRLRDTYVPMDPRGWDATMDVAVNVGLGAGTTAERLAALRDLAARQEQILQQMGPSNPLVGLPEYRATLEKMYELGGVAAVAKHLKPIPKDYQPPPPPPPQPDPALIIAQVEAQKAQQKAQYDVMKLQIDDDFRRDEMIVKAMVEAGKQGVTLKVEEIRQIARNRDGTGSPA